MQKIIDIILQKKLILWDFDGCFCDSEPLHYEAYAKAFAKFGHKLKMEEYFNTFTHTGGGAAKEIKDYNLSCDPDFIRQDKLNIYSELIIEGKAKLFPEMPDILNKLSQLKIKNVIASNSLKDEIEIILKNLKQPVQVDNIFGVLPGLRKKPAPDIFNYALKETGFNPRDALVIEDSERGLFAAQEAGCQAIWVETYLTKDYTSSAPYLEKISHKNLLSILNNIEKKN